jgi:hypothetical protein
MKRASTILSRALLFSIPLSAALAMGAPGEALAQGYPPPEYIATQQPEYFEGRPVYYYGGTWYYRDRGAWSYYHGEPAYLRDRRSHWDEHRRYRYHR